MGRALAAAREKLDGHPLTFTEIDELGRVQVIEARPERWGDAVIVRKEVPASYHLAVVVDDAGQGVTHVTRGQDLFAATDLHRLLQVPFGLEAPLYHHHRLVMDAHGRKLAKSDGDTSLRSLRERGARREEIRAMIGR
jgi:glutamyl-Q tRNA(Asp) synthetase